MAGIICHTFCLCTLFVTGGIGVLIQRPLNVATNVGGETVFNCSTNTTNAVTWMYTADCDIATGTPITENNCSVISSQASHYRTEKPGGNFCNLIVFNAMLSHGGCYACTDGFGAGTLYYANLIIVDSTATIVSNSTDVIPGEDVMISSSVSYGGPSLQPPSLPPSFYWTLQSDPSQNITSYSGSITTTIASSYIVVTAQPPNVPPYLCNLFFKPPVNVPSTCAVNAPTYRTSYVTPPYNVLYNLPPSIMATPHFESSICEAKILSCQPNAYPQAQTYWVDLQNNTNIYDQFITAEYLGEYLCVANNVYRNTSHQTVSSYSLSDRGQFSQTPCQFAESAKVEIILPSEARCDNFTCRCPCCTETVLKCHVPTLPEAEYKWLFGDRETAGPTIKPEADGNYTCIAYNTVNNQRFAGHKSISISQFYEFPPHSPASDDTAVIVLSVFLAVSILVIIGLVTWIVFWVLPKLRSIPESTPSPYVNSSRQDAYEDVAKSNNLPEPSTYESLQQPTASAYQELTLRQDRRS